MKLLFRTSRILISPIDFLLCVLQEVNEQSLLYKFPKFPLFLSKIHNKICSALQSGHLHSFSLEVSKLLQKQRMSERLRDCNFKGSENSEIPNGISE